MHLDFLAKGALIGLSIAAPVGPIGLLCIRRSLTDGSKAGFVTGLGAATADAFYGMIAGFGLTAVSNFLVDQRLWLGLLGGVFLCYLGVRTALSPPPEREAKTSAASDLRSAYLSTFALTLTNPMTILSFVAVFAGFGLVGSPSYVASGILVLGVFLGSAAWWLFLSGVAGGLRTRVQPSWMVAVNRLSGAMLCLFGAYALASPWLR
ncbi:MAG: LysE family translocator [Verrucomicrobiales bacterium]|nr:LysE family translocator [Verrucomicrobiales bacterium]